MGITISKDMPVPGDMSPRVENQFSFIDINSDSSSNESDTSLDKKIEKPSEETEDIKDNKDDNQEVESLVSNLNDKNISEKEISQSAPNVNDNKELQKEIDQFIEDWFDENKEVDLGNVSILNQKIDLIPDSIEKIIYKKSILIGITFIKKILSESKVSFLNQEMKISFK